MSRRGVIEEEDSQPTSRTNLFIGNLVPEVGTEQLRDLFEPFGVIESCRVMMDGATRSSRGFGFVKYRTHDEACYAIQCMNNSTSKDGIHMLVKFANASDEEHNYPTNNVFVKGLPVTINAESIKALFSPYGTITETKILTDSATQQSRGQALVRFMDVDSATRAIEALNNYKYPGTAKGIVVKFADSDHTKTDRRQKLQRKSFGFNFFDEHTYYASMQDYPPPPYYPPPYHFGGGGGGHHHHHHHSPPMAAAPQDPNNLYIYHLPPEADDATLYRLFAPFGAIQSVKIGRDPETGGCKGFGFVRMVSNADAWAALTTLNGHKLGTKTLSVTFKK